MQLIKLTTSKQRMILDKVHICLSQVQYFVLFASVLLILVQAGKNGGGKKCGKQRKVVTLATHGCECTKKTQRTLNYRDGNVLVCNGEAWTTVNSAAAYGSEDAPGKSCKDILKQRQNLPHHDGRCEILGRSNHSSSNGPVFRFTRFTAAPQNY